MTQLSFFDKILLYLNFCLIFFIILYGSDIFFESTRVSIIIPEPSPIIEPIKPIQPKAARLSTISIPALQIKAPIVSVGITATQNMDVPKDTSTVGWYVYGPKPGEPGNTIFTAHYDTATGKPAIFYHLRDLNLGDEIQIIDESEQIFTYTVTQVTSYPIETAPTDYIHAENSDQLMTLITCDGIWDSQTKIYSHRLVVFAHL